MRKEAVLHIPLSQYAYAESEHRIVIRIRVQKNDIDKCMLYYGDRVDVQEPIRTFEVEMKKVAADDMFEYFEAYVEDIYTRVCYYFKLDDGKECLYYYSRGFCKEMLCHRTEYFQFPYIRREDVHSIPDWANNLVMYHIFPDSFATAKRYLENAKKEKWMDGIRSESNLGGTLKGVEENLDYISDMGINCIYLNPIFTANSYHKYDTIDYFDIDPCFGQKEDLKNLVKACHDRGMKVILDGVFNHCGPDFFAFKDVIKNGKDSRYYDWFYHMPVPIKYQDPPNYEAFAYVKEMPKLNTGNPEVMKYLCEVGTYWIEEADIDGWRLDVANEINHDFWRKFRSAVREKKQECFLIAEIWEDSNIWLQGDQFDSSMNYTFSYLCRDFFATRSISVSEFDQQIQKMIMRYPEKISLAQMNFLDSHDVPRFLSYCDGDRRRMRLAFFYLFMSMGIPSVFYGDECFIQGKTEPEYRAAMDWNKGKNEAFAAWIRIRKTYKALSNGKYKTIMTDDERGIYAFLREYENEKILVLINNGDVEQRIDKNFFPEENLHFINVETKKEEEEIVIPSMEGKIYLLENNGV